MYAGKLWGEGAEGPNLLALSLNYTYLIMPVKLKIIAGANVLVGVIFYKFITFFCLDRYL